MEAILLNYNKFSGITIPNRGIYQDIIRLNRRKERGKKRNKIRSKFRFSDSTDF